MGNTNSLSSLDEQLVATSKETIESVVDTGSKEVFRVSGFFTSEPEEGYPNIEGFNHTTYYLLDEVSGYKYNILTKADEENVIYYYIVRLFTDRKLDQPVRERLEQEKSIVEEFPNFIQRVEFHNATLKQYVLLDLLKILKFVDIISGVEKTAALFKVGSDEGNSFMSLFGLNGGMSYYTRIRLVSSAILNVAKIFELSERRYCFYPIDISHMVVQDSLNVRFFDCIHTIADQNDRESIFNLGFRTICKIGACILTSNEALYDKNLFHNEWLSSPDIPIPIFSTLFKKVLLDSDFTLDNIRNELRALELLTIQHKESPINDRSNFKDLVNIYTSLLSHRQSDPFHDPYIQQITKLISTAAEQHREYHQVLLECNENSSLCTLLLISIFKRDLTNNATNISNRIMEFSNIFKGLFSEKSELIEMTSNALINSRKKISNDLGVSHIILDAKSFIISLFSSNNLSISEEELDNISKKIYG